MNREFNILNTKLNVLFQINKFFFAKLSEFLLIKCADLTRWVRKLGQKCCEEHI